MQVRATVKDVYGSRVTLETDSASLFEKSLDNQIVFEIKGQGRSLNANSYFHVLSDKIAEKLHVSKPFAKNTLMSKYGQKERDDDGKQLMLSVDEKIDLLERSDIHCEIKGYGHVEGKTFIHYGLLKPTHVYSSKEFSLLLEGTVQDAKDLGIETIPPEELQRMINKWKIK